MVLKADSATRQLLFTFTNIVIYVLIFNNYFLAVTDGFIITINTIFRFRSL